MKDVRAPLARVKGLGSAKDGTSHFWYQRLTALALIPLVLWVGYSLASLPVDYETLSAFIRQPAVAIGLILLVIMVFYHSQLGLQVVIEDYVSSHAIRAFMIILCGFLNLILAVAGVVAILKILFEA